MTGVNQFARVADGAAADVEEISAWLGESTLLAGGFPGAIVRSDQFNRALRQSTAAMAILGSHVANILNENVIDDPTSTIELLWTQIWNAMLSHSAFPDVGVANALLTANPYGLVMPAPTAGMIVTVKVAASNTGAATYNHMGHGNVQLLNTDGTALKRGALTANAYAMFQYSSTGPAWLMISSSPGQIRGLSFGVAVDVINIGSGNYTVPANTYLIQPILYGGGGGSTDSAASPSGAICGGGSGGCCVGTPIETQPGATFSYVVGGGGVHSTYGATGGNGGTTTFNGGALSAGGGGGSSLAAVGVGGTASGGLFNMVGAPGNPFGSQDLGSAGGTGASSMGPYGAGGGAASTGIATDGSVPGAGAGGPGSGGLGSPGKDGGSGIVYVLR